MMELIGAGMPRTGTLTQKVAFELLGLAPCFHWVDILADLESQVPQWDGAIDGTVDPASIMGDARSCADWPGGFFYQQLMESYPNAKVLLSVRDPDRWEPSFTETIVDMCYGESMIRLLSSARAQVDPNWRRYLDLVEKMFFGDKGSFPDGYTPDALKEAFVAHNEAVKRTVPPERLLVWDVSEGWEPLCGFLDLPVPSEPFPHANDRATFLSRVITGALTTLQAWHTEQEAA
jgi:hypothetical protein